MNTHSNSNADADAAPPDLRQRLRGPLMWSVPVIVVLAIAYFYFTGGRYVSTDNAYVKAAQVAISSNVSGRVSAVNIRDNQLVNRGEVLFSLDDAPFRIAVEQAQAQLANARLQVLALKAIYRQRQADVQSAEDTLAYQESEYARQKRLFASGIASQAQVDKTLHARDEAKQQVAAAQQQVASVLASLNGNPNIVVDQHPTVQQAQAEVNRSNLNLSYTVIAAPSAGIVTKVEQLQVGDFINAATPVFALVSSQDIWVEANFKEVQLAHMLPGQPVTINVDAYPDKPLKGRVISVSPGTGSQFSALPAENATGNWVKVVQRLPVRIEIDDRDPKLALHMGLSATVEVDTNFHRHLFGADTQDIDLPTEVAKSH